MKILIVDCIDHGRAQLVRAINEAPDAQRCVGAINVALDSGSDTGVIKYGVYPNSRGLQIFDREAAEAIVRAANTLSERAANMFRGLPIYVGHPDDAEWARMNPGVRAEAVGRMPSLEVAADGLRFKKAFNDTGKRLLTPDAPAYDSFSPNWGMVPTTYQGRKAFRPVELYSIGLTNHPNIPGSYIGLNEQLPAENQTSPDMKKHIIAMLAALGRPVADAATVTDEQLATAINEAVPVATQVVAAAAELPTVKASLTAAVNEKSALQTQLTAAQGQVTTAVNESATLRTSLTAERAARAGIVLTNAINEGRITEAQRAEWLGKLTADGADFSAVSTQLGALKKAINTRSQADIAARRQQHAAPKKITAINEAIAAKMTAMGTGDRMVAYNALVAEGHELFKSETAAE